MLGRILLRGLFAVLPIAITIALIWWVLASVELVFAFVLRPIMGEAYVPGMGLVLGLAIVFMAGVLMSTWVVRKTVRVFEAQLLKLPLIKTLYGSVRDMLSLFSASKRQDFSRVVTVKWGDQRLLGFVTRERFDNLPQGLADQTSVAVYLPMSYQLGGFTVLVPRDDVQPVDMTLEEAMKFAITAGVTSETPSGAVAASDAVMQRQDEEEGPTDEPAERTAR